MNKFVPVFTALFLILTSVAACGGLPFIAANDPTATPSRTPRATFTPRPLATDTPQVTDTPEITDTPEATTEPTEAPPTATKKPAGPTAKPLPTGAPQPTTPKFPIFLDSSIHDPAKYECAQDGIWEVIIYAKDVGPKGKRVFAGNLYYGAFQPGGGILQDGAGKNMTGVTASAFSISIGANCQIQADFVNPNTSNGKLDVGDAVRRGQTQVAIRFIKSPTDFTPLSQDVIVDFGVPGRWWLYYGHQP